MSAVERIDSLINQEIEILGNKKFESYKYELKLDVQTLFQLKATGKVKEDNTYKGIDIDMTISKGLIMLSEKQRYFGASCNKYYYRNYIIKRVGKGVYDVLLDFKLLETGVKSIALAKELVLHHDRYKNLEDFKLRKSA